MDIVGIKHPVVQQPTYQDTDPEPREDGLIDPPGSPPPTPANPSLRAPIQLATRTVTAAPIIPPVPPAPQMAVPVTQIQQQVYPAPVVSQAVMAVPSIVKGGGSGITKIKETLDNKKNNWLTWSESMMTLFDINDVVEFVVSAVPFPDSVYDPIGAKNWCFNNSFAKICIDNNTAPTEKVYTQSCPTAHKMWTNLRSIYKSEDYMVYMDQLKSLLEIQAVEGTNIPKHLARLKRQWDKLALFSKHNKLMGDAFFKCIIAQSLPRSWNAFTNPYVQGHVDKTDKDPNKRVNSQQLIGLIKQEYKMIKSQKKRDAKAQKQSEKNNSSLANRLSESSNNKKASTSNGFSNLCAKKHCKHCGQDNHYKLEC